MENRFEQLQKKKITRARPSRNGNIPNYEF